jgi:hypothetical protein
LLQLSGDVHAEHLAELGVLGVLVDDLFALQTNARLETGGGDLVFADLRDRFDLHLILAAMQ